MVAGMVGIRLVGGHAGGVSVKCAVGGEDVHDCLGRMAREDEYGAPRPHSITRRRLWMPLTLYDKHQVANNGLLAMVLPSDLVHPAYLKRQNTGRQWLPASSVRHAAVCGRETPTLWNL